MDLHAINSIHQNRVRVQDQLPGGVQAGRDDRAALRRHPGQAALRGATARPEGRRLRRGEGSPRPAAHDLITGKKRRTPDREKIILEKSGRRLNVDNLLARLPYAVQ